MSHSEGEQEVIEAAAESKKTRFHGHDGVIKFWTHFVCGGIKVDA